MKIFVQTDGNARNIFRDAPSKQSEVIEMKQILAGVLLLALLAGCGGRAADVPSADPAPLEKNAQSGQPQETPAPKGLSMRLEREIYDPSLSSYTYFIENGTEETVEFGSDYAIQRLEGDAWREMAQRDGWAFTAIGYGLNPGGTMALTCALDRYEEPPQAGKYRLVKAVGETVLYAEFQLGESIYTAEAPCGFAPLEELPETYGAGTAGEADVVFSERGAENLNAAAEFLFKASLGAPCQLRTVQDYGEGAPMITDVIFENGHFMRRMSSGGIVTQERYAYIVTDGTELFLSNGADWENTEKYGSRRAHLLPEGMAADMTAAVEEMTASRLRGNAVRYRIWSADGVWWAGLAEGDSPTEFSVQWQKPGEGIAGSSYDLQDWDGVETAILELSWQEDNTLRLRCADALGGQCVRIFDPEAERLTGALCGLPLNQTA